MKRAGIFLLFLFCLPLFAQEIHRPITEQNDYFLANSTVCTQPSEGTYNSLTGEYDDVIVYQDMSSMTEFHDTGALATGSSLDVSAGYKESGTNGGIFFDFPAASDTYTALTLNVNSTCTHMGSGGISRCGLEYSVDGGLSWTAIKSNSSWLQTTDTVSLSPTQDLTKLVVRACAFATTYSRTSIYGSLTGYDIWTSGTLTSGGGGDSGGTSARRRIIVVTK